MPGYDVVIAAEGEYEEFKCYSCRFLIKDAFQLMEDGRRICQSCMDDDQHSKTVGDQQLLGHLKDGQLSNLAMAAKGKGCFPDRFAQRIVDQISVYCKFKPNGCTWVGPVKDFEQHLESCYAKPAQCPDCLLNVPAHTLEQHLTYECRNRMVECKFCGERVTFASLESHVDACKMRPISCNKCESVLSPDEMEDHRSVWCQGTIGPCCFNKEGCDHAELMDKEGVMQHVSQNLVFHILLLLCYVKKIVRRLGEVSRNLFATKEDLCHKVETLTNSTHDIHSKMIEWTDFLKENVERQWKEVHLTKKKGLEGEAQLMEMAVAKTNFENEVAGIHHKVFFHESQIKEQLSAISEVQKQVRSMVDKVDALRTALYEIRQSQQKPAGGDSRAAPVYPLPYSPDHHLSFNGELTWKIENVTKLRQEAILNKRTSFFSPAFFTSASGYMCCGRVYMNGDGAAKGTNISLFFVVMKGPYDALQKWPFNKKVTLMLLNQDGKDDHAESFSPDPNSTSFQRPKRDMNPSCGSPFFYSLTTLGKDGYLKDDTIFLRIKIGDLSE